MGIGNVFFPAKRLFIGRVRFLSPGGGGRPADADLQAGPLPVVLGARGRTRPGLRARTLGPSLGAAQVWLPGAAGDL